MFDLVVLGSGVAGLAIADAAAQNGVTCAILDFEPLVGFASVRNQGWLHSGALYASGHSSGRASTVELCRRGWQAFHDLQSGLGEKLLSEEPSLMVFKDARRLEYVLENLRHHKMMAVPFDHRQLEVAEPILTPGVFTGGILTSDVSFDGPKILNGLARRAHARGAVFFALKRSALLQMRMERIGSCWRILADDFNVDAANVVLASGVLTPTLSKRLLDYELAGTIWKATVLALDCAAVAKIVTIREEATSSMTVAPCPGGITVNLGDLDDRSDKFDDHTIPGSDERNILTTLSDYAGGLASFLPARGRFYTCQKYDPPEDVGRGRRDYFVEPIQENVYVAYPGKFTQALIAADDLISRLTFQGRTLTRIDSESTCWSYKHPSTEAFELRILADAGEFIQQPLRSADKGDSYCPSQ
ncbi:glycine/D-amino acid oxidase-like deaminating enzyme [Bradyrhizobium japonicum]